MKISSRQFDALRRPPWGQRRRLLDSLLAMGHEASLDAKSGDLILASVTPGPARIRFRVDGQVESIDEASGRMSRFELDGKGRVVAVATTSGINRFQYGDGPGQVTAMTDARGLTSSVVFRDGRPVEIRRHERASIGIKWGAEGRLAGLTDGRGASLRFEHGAHDQITRIVERGGAETTYKYEETGQLQALRTPRGGTWQFFADAATGSGTVVRPDGSRVERFAPSANVERFVRADGSQVIIGNDAAGRPEKIEYPDGPTLSLHWTPEGQLADTDNGQHRTRFEYDAAGRRTVEDVDGARVACRYDDQGQIAGITLPTGESLAFVSDTGGRVREVCDWDGNRYAIEWSSTGEVTGIQFPGPVRERMQSTQSGQLDTQELVSGNRRISRSYSYDANDLVAGVKDSARGSTSLEYDADDRLVAVTSSLGRVAYAYDADGNMRSAGGRHYEYDLLNRITGGTGVRCRCDSLGNLVDWEDEKGHARYLYDGQGLLVRSELSGGRLVEYEYDALGRRLRKRISGITTRYTWLGTQLIAEESDGPRPTRTDYLYLPGTSRPLAMRRDGRLFFYQTDHLETPIRLLDCQGAVVWEGEPFGVEFRVVTQKVAQPLRFPGQYFDAETGLHYNVARYYQPATGRYITPDPLFHDGGANQYTYARANPAFFVDPTGRIVPLILGVLALGVVVGAGFAVAHQISTNAVHGDPWYKDVGSAAAHGAVAGLGGAAGAIVGGVAGFFVGGPVGAVVGALAGGFVGSALASAGMAAYEAPEGKGWEACKDALINSVPFVGSVRRYVDHPEDNERGYQLLLDLSFDVLGLALMALGARKGLAQVRARSKPLIPPADEKPPVPPGEEKTLVVSRDQILAEQQRKQTIEESGKPSGANTWRQGEVPYHNPPEMKTVKPGQPLDLSSLDPGKKYLWIVDEEGNIRIAAEEQADFGRNQSYPKGRAVKHGDLAAPPGEGTPTRGPARAGGELNAILDSDGKPSGLWEMNNDSSYTFNRTDGVTANGANLNAAVSLMEQSGTDTSKILPNNSSGDP